MYNFIKRMYETKRDNGLYVYNDADIDQLVVLKRLTAEQAIEIKQFVQV